MPQCRSTGTRACPLNAAELQPSVDLAKLCWTFAAVLAHLHCFVPGSILPCLAIPVVKKCQEQLLFGARYTISIGLNIEEKGAQRIFPEKT